jgi:hypothetical protein
MHLIVRSILNSCQSLDADRLLANDNTPHWSALALTRLHGDLHFRGLMYRYGSAAARAPICPWNAHAGAPDTATVLRGFLQKLSIIQTFLEAWCRMRARSLESGDG